MHKISECQTSYLTNRCDPDTRIPAMQSLCTEWEKCMAKDPKEIGKLKVFTETLAEIVNKFIEPLSYKSMFFLIVLILGVLFITNFAFGIIRHRKYFGNGASIQSSPSSSLQLQSSSATQKSLLQHNTDTTAATASAAAAAAVAAVSATTHLYHQQNLFHQRRYGSSSTNASSSERKMLMDMKRIDSGLQDL